MARTLFTTTVIFTTLALVLEIWAISVWARPQQNCAPCPPEGCPVPRGCPFGVAVDKCGINSCAKGPGVRCNLRRFPMHGNCGHGMYCHCGYCNGCSLDTYECFENTCAYPMLG